MCPGIVTRGQGQNAQVFIRGISAVNTPKEVLFIVNGNQTGSFSRTFFSLNSVEITDIRLLKKATEIAAYGFAGSGGVVLISTKQWELKKGHLNKPQIALQYTLPRTKQATNEVSEDLPLFIE